MYRFETIYTRDNIRILARVQVHTYYWKKLIMMLLSGMILIGVSLTWVNSGQLTALLAAAGCWLCISLTYPAQYLSRSIHKKMDSHICFVRMESALKAVQAEIVYPMIGSTKS